MFDLDKEGVDLQPENRWTGLFCPLLVKEIGEGEYCKLQMQFSFYVNNCPIAFLGGLLTLPIRYNSTTREEAETSRRLAALSLSSQRCSGCYSEIKNKNIDSSLLSCLQPLTIFQRSLTTMQIQIQGLLQFAVPLFPTAEVSHTLGHSSSTLLSPYDYATSPSSPPLACRGTWWVSSTCLTPPRPACTSWLPCWTAEGSTRLVPQEGRASLTHKHTHRVISFGLQTDFWKIPLNSLQYVQETTCFWLVCLVWRHLLCLITLTP